MRGRETLLATALLILSATVVVVGANLLRVPITQDRYQDCVNRAETEHKPLNNCPQTETLWEKGLSDPVAYYTLALTFFTLALAVGAFTQSRLIGRQINLSRDEFLATHRPRMVVRSVTMLPGSTTKDEKEGPAIIDFMAANAGGAMAEIVSFIAIGYVRNESKAFLPLLSQRGERRYPPNLKFAPGQSILIRAHGPNIDWDYEVWKAEGDGQMFVIGEIEYRGPDTITRTMGFCREYNRDDGMWYPHNNPAYEFN